MLTIIIAILSSSAFSTLATALIFKVINKRKDVADTEGQEFLNVKTLIEISNKTFEELRLAREEISTLTTRVNELTEANGKLDCEVQHLRREIKKQHNENKQ